MPGENGISPSVCQTALISMERHGQDDDHRQKMLKADIADTPCHGIGKDKPGTEAQSRRQKGVHDLGRKQPGRHCNIIWGS